MPAKQPFHIMTQSIGPACNLDCTYCFYLQKESLFPENHKASDFRMNDATLENDIRQYIAGQPGQEVCFAWQGGGPTLLGLDYFRRIVELQKIHTPPGKTNIQYAAKLLTHFKSLADC